MGLLKAFDQIVWGFFVFELIALIVVWIYLPYILGGLAVWLAINQFVAQHRLRQRAPVPGTPPPQSPEGARSGKFRFKKIQIKKVSATLPERLPIDIVLPNGSEIREIK